MDPPTEGEWEARRAIIEERYRDYTLKEVHDYMRTEHNFRATERMYKRHFSMWGIKKNVCVNEMADVARQALELGNSTDKAAKEQFAASLNAQKLTRFLRRTSQPLDSFIKQRKNSAENSSASIPRNEPSRTVEGLGDHERMLHCIDIYFVASLDEDRGIWKNVGDSQFVFNSLGSRGRFTAGDLERSIDLASRLTCTEDLGEANRAWGCVSSIITSVVEREDLKTWTFLCSMILRLRCEGRLELAHSILRQCSELFQKLKGATSATVASHPMHQLCIYLLEAEPSSLGQMLFVTDQRVADTIEAQLGQAHMEAFVQRSFLITRLTSEKDKACEMKSLIPKSQSMNLPLDQRQLYLWRDYSAILLDQQDYDGVIKEVSEILRQLGDLDSLAPPKTLITILACLSISYQMLNSTELAAQTYQKLLELIKRRAEYDLMSLISTLLEVESLLYFVGMFHQATEIYGFRIAATKELFDNIESEERSRLNGRSDLSTMIQDAPGDACKTNSSAETASIASTELRGSSKASEPSSGSSSSYQPPDRTNPVTAKWVTTADEEPAVQPNSDFDLTSDKAPPSLERAPFFVDSMRDCLEGSQKRHNRKNDSLLRLDTRHECLRQGRPCRQCSRDPGECPIHDDSSRAVRAPVDLSREGINKLQAAGSLPVYPRDFVSHSPSFLKTSAQQLRLKSLREGSPTAKSISHGSLKSRKGGKENKAQDSMNRAKGTID